MLPNKKYSALDVLQIGRRRSVLLVVPAAAGLFIALLLSSRMPDVFQSEMLIQIVPQRVPDTYVRSTVTMRTEDRLDALSQQVRSRTQLERIITDLDLYLDERKHIPMQDVVELMKSSIGVELVRSVRNEADAFYLRFDYHDGATAARVTERLGRLYIDYNARERGALADATNQFLESQLADSKARLDALEKRLQAFRERHAGRLPSQLEYNMQAIQNTNLQRQAVVESLARDRDRKLMLERLYNEAVAEPAPVPLAVPQAPNLDPTALVTMSPKQQLDIARAAQSRLELRLKEGHPDLKRARKQVEDLERQVASAATNGGQTPPAALGQTAEELQRRERIRQMHAEIESLDRQIAFKDSEDRRLNALIRDYQNRIEAVPGVESEWLSLTRDYDTQQAAFKDLLTKSESARVAADLENRQVGEQFRVLDAPRVPVRPIRPERRLLSVGGLGAGLLLGILLIGALEWRESSFRTELDVERVLGLPVIALVPVLVTAKERKSRRVRHLIVVGGVAIAMTSAGYVVWALKLWRFVA